MELCTLLSAFALKDWKYLELKKKRSNTGNEFILKRKWKIKFLKLFHLREAASAASALKQKNKKQNKTKQKNPNFPHQKTKNKTESW